MKRKNSIILPGLSLAILGGVVVMANGKTIFRTNANDVWYHFAALMPTADKGGIREYWSRCDGTDPVFENPGYSAIELTHNASEVDAILAIPGDERIIPSLTKIQNAGNATLTGASAHEYTHIKNAYAYNYLDAATKASITGNYSNIDTIKATWEDNFEVIWDAGKDAFPHYGNLKSDGLLSRAYDATYGDCIAINIGSMNANETFEAYFYNFSSKTYDTNAKLHIGVKSPFAAATSTSQTYFCGTYSTAKKFTATPNGWTLINEKGSDLNTNGAYTTSFGGAISLQRYINASSANVDAYTGTYYMTSIIADKISIADGTVILSSTNSFIDKKTWNDDGAVITQNVNTTDHGICNQIDIENKTTVFEAEWSGVDPAIFANFETATVYVYAPVACPVFFSLQNWRNKVVNVGVDPYADDNGTVANSHQSDFLSIGWNTISFPASYIKADTTKIYFEIWNNTTGNETGWLVSSIYGFNS